VFSLKKNVFLKTTLNSIPLYRLINTNDNVTLNQLLYEKLFHIVNYAIKNIDYYTKYSQILSLDDFKNIVFIDKNIVNENFDRFINHKRKKWGDWITTGGTSGKPLNLILPKTRFIQEYATIFKMWKRMGWDFDKIAVIRNHKLYKKHKKDIIKNMIIFDGFHLNDNYFSYIYDTIKRYNVNYIHAYPSTAFEFCKYLKRYNKDTFFIKAIFSGSENIFPYQIDFIENSLNIRFYNWYGHSEKLVLGGYCEYTKNYHIEPLYGYFELIDEKGKTINEPGKIGEIVGTTLYNTIMPLIRYRTGDYAEYVSNHCNKCGRKQPLIKNIQGRWDGLKIYYKDGTYITTTGLNLHSDLYKYIDGLQYIQKKKGYLDILIIPSDEFTKEIEEKFYNFFALKLQNNLTVNIVKVQKLIRKDNGKFVQLISEVEK
jgi:phenylacetate-CoA ligase